MKLEHVASHLNLIAVVEWDAHGTLDSYAIDPDAVARRVDHDGAGLLGVHADLEVVPRHGHVVAQQDPMNVVHPGALATDEDPVYEGPTDLARAPRVHNDAAERPAFIHRGAHLVGQGVQSSARWGCPVGSLAPVGE